MEKVTEKWFKEHGWVRDEDITTEENGTVRKNLRYILNNGKTHARYDRLIYIYPPRWKGEKKRISRFYMFYAHGKNGFQVENRISNFNFPIETIVAALKAVGYDEFGKK